MNARQNLNSELISSLDELEQINTKEIVLYNAGVKNYKRIIESYSSFLSKDCLLKENLDIEKFSEYIYRMFSENVISKKYNDYSLTLFRDKENLTKEIFVFKDDEKNFSIEKTNKENEFVLSFELGYFGFQKITYYIKEFEIKIINEIITDITAIYNGKYNDIFKNIENNKNAIDKIIENSNLKNKTFEKYLFRDCVCLDNVSILMKHFKKNEFLKKAKIIAKQMNNLLKEQDPYTIIENEFGSFYKYPKSLVFMPKIYFPNINIDDRGILSFFSKKELNDCQHYKLNKINIKSVHDVICDFANNDLL